MTHRERIALTLSYPLTTYRVDGVERTAVVLPPQFPAVAHGMGTPPSGPNQGAHHFNRPKGANQ